MEDGFKEPSCVPYEIRYNSLYRYNKHCIQLLTEARVHLSFFEAEKNCEKEKKIVYNNEKIDPSFAWIQRVMFESLILSVARLYDESCEEYEKFTIPDLLKETLANKDLLQGYVDSYYQNKCGDVETMIRYFQDILITPEISDILWRIKRTRNEFLAHNDIHSQGWKHYGIDLKRLEIVINIGFTIADYINCCFTNLEFTKNDDGSVKIGGIDWFNNLFKVTAAGVTKYEEEPVKPVAEAVTPKDLFDDSFSREDEQEEELGESLLASVYKKDVSESPHKKTFFTLEDLGLDESKITKISSSIKF